MMNRIKEEKLFFGVIGGILLVLLVWNSMVRSSLREDIDRAAGQLNMNRGELRTLSEGGSVGEEQLTPARESMQDVNVKLTRLAERVKYVRDPRFEVPKDQTAMNYFNHRRILGKELAEKATKKVIGWNPSIGQLGFKGEQVLDEQADEYLIRLDLVYRVLEALYDLSGQANLYVQSIEGVNPLVGIDMNSGPVIVRDRFLNKVTVQIRFKSNGLTAFRLVHGLGNPERKNQGALNIEEFVLDRTDPTVDIVDVTLSVSAILVDVGKSLEGAP